MDHSSSHFEIPRNIERILATLSKGYEAEGLSQLQAVIVNSEIRIDEAVSHYDNLEVVRYGHAIHFMVHQNLFSFTIKHAVKIQEKMESDLNHLLAYPNEFIAKVSLEMDVENVDWRKASGLQVSGQRTVPPVAEHRIWGEKESFRVFLSHIAKYKSETANLKERLETFGMSCFVAHENIKPSKEWPDEIELALASMHGFVALVTDGFHESLWTDQEIGFAFARRVPIIPVRLGKDPYGFIGNIQAIRSTWSDCGLLPENRHENELESVTERRRTDEGESIQRSADHRDIARA